MNGYICFSSNTFSSKFVLTVLSNQRFHNHLQHNRSYYLGQRRWKFTSGACHSDQMFGDEEFRNHLSLDYKTTFTGKEELNLQQQGGKVLTTGHGVAL